MDEINRDTLFLLNESTYFTQNHEYFKMYCSKGGRTGQELMKIPVKIKDQDGMAFMDSGCTFNAMSEAFARKCGLEIKEYDKILECAVGGGNSIRMKRRVVCCTIDLLTLGTLKTYVFVMDPIPLDCDIIFGMDFLRTVNPIINWQTGIALPGDEVASTQDEKYLDEIKYNNAMFYYREHGYKSSTGVTKVIGWEEYEEEMADCMASGGDMVFFVMQPRETSTEKAQRYQEQGWDKLKDNPALPVLY